MLAPMVGLSHFVVRKALQEYLPPRTRVLWPTEMLSSKRIPYQKAQQSIETNFSDVDAGLCPQLLGNEEPFIRDSIKKLEDWGARAVDINMGCPVDRALRHNYGVALMGDLDYAARVCEYATRHARVPVSVKLRSGFGHDPEFLTRFVRALQNAGAAWVTLHPRSAEQRRRGEADWQQIRQLKTELNIALIGNGDVQNPQSLRDKKSASGADRIMIGRALLAKPWLLDPLAAPDDWQAGALYGKFLARVLELSREHYPEDQGLRRYRFLVYHGSVWLEFGHTFYAQCTKAKSYAELETVREKFFAQPQRMHRESSGRH